MDREGKKRRYGEEQYSGDNDGVDISALGVRVGAHGRNAVLVALAASAVGLILSAGWLHHSEMEQQNKILSQQISEMIYVLSLSSEAREALNISMPDSLRGKLRRNRDER